APLPRAPRRSFLEQLGPRERDHVEPVRARPLEEVLDEVEQARVGPLQVLEHEDGGVGGREALEEESPGREQFLPIAALALAGTEELRGGGLDETALVVVEEVLREGCAELLADDGRLVVLRDLAA